MPTDRRQDVLVQLRVVVAVVLLAVGVALVAWPVGTTPAASAVLWLQVVAGGVTGVVGARQLTQLLQR